MVYLDVWKAHQFRITVTMTEQKKWTIYYYWLFDGKKKTEIEGIEIT